MCGTHRAHLAADSKDLHYVCDGCYGTLSGMVRNEDDDCHAIECGIVSNGQPSPQRPSTESGTKLKFKLATIHASNDEVTNEHD